MRLSQQAIDDLLQIIIEFDRMRGIPHNYIDLERCLQKIEVEIKENKIFVIPPGRIIK